MNIYLIPYQGDLYRITLRNDGTFFSATVKPAHDSYVPEPLLEEDVPLKVIQKAFELFSNETSI